MLAIARSSFKLFPFHWKHCFDDTFFVLIQDILVTPVLRHRVRCETAPCITSLTLNQGSTRATRQNPSSFFTINPPRTHSQRFLQRVPAGEDAFRADTFSQKLCQLTLRSIPPHTRSHYSAIQGHSSAIRAWDCIAVVSAFVLQCRWTENLRSTQARMTTNRTSLEGAQTWNADPGSNLSSAIELSLWASMYNEGKSSDRFTMRIRQENVRKPAAHS